MGLLAPVDDYHPGDQGGQRQSPSDGQGDEQQVDDGRHRATKQGGQRQARTESHSRTDPRAAGTVVMGVGAIHHRSPPTGTSRSAGAGAYSAAMAVMSESVTQAARTRTGSGSVSS